MEKEFVIYELAVKLKALGFDEPCFKYVYTGDTGINVNHYLEVEPAKAKNYNADDLCVSQPTFSQAFRWFREKYGLCNFIKFSGDGFCSGWEDLGNNEHGFENFKTYEEAELECLEKLIEIVEGIESQK